MLPELPDRLLTGTPLDSGLTTGGGGGTPTAFDRVLSTRFGIAAIDAVHDGAFGHMVALQAGDIVRVPLSDATGELKLVDPELYDVARVFSG